MAFGLGRKVVKCPFCGYDKHRPDFSTSVCINCGGNLRFEGGPGYKLPRKWRRNLAFWIDLLPLGLALWLVELLTGDNFSRSDSAIWISLIYLLAYFVILPYLFGLTLGQKILGLRTLDTRTKENPPLGRLALREILFLTIFTGLGLLYYLFRGFYWDTATKITTVEQ